MSSSRSVARPINSEPPGAAETAGLNSIVWNFILAAELEFYQC